MDVAARLAEHILARSLPHDHGAPPPGMTILMVEQNARLALHASDRACVLRTNSVVLEGRAQDLIEDEAVKKAYLG